MSASVWGVSVARQLCSVPGDEETNHRRPIMGGTPVGAHERYVSISTLEIEMSLNASMVDSVMIPRWFSDSKFLQLCPAAN